MASQLFITISLASILLLSSCGGTKQDQISKEFQLEKKEVIGKFEAMGTDIDQTIEELDTQIAAEEGRVKRRLEKAKKELLKKKEAIHSTMNEINLATDENWKTIKKETDQLLKEVSIDMSGLRQKINNVMEEISEELNKR